jgi:arylsulfatase A-like enzyme
MTSTILPYPQTDTHFTGRIGQTYTGSEAFVPSVPSAPAGAPNVLLVLLDDVGFGHAATFGGPVATPTLDRLAGEGLRYNRFHTTALCSPTRAAILSGRNHHSMHTGIIMELATGFPGYDGRWPENAVCVAETLRRNHYNTAAFGKWHNTPDFETSPAGPYDRWPSGHGFEYFWGFQGGETNNWNPPLFENTTPTQKPEGDENWHLTSAMADKAIAWIGAQKASAPDKPFFAYFAPGAAHAPHHAPREYIERYKGKFDQGWDTVREETLARQIALGVVPKGTKLTPRPDSMPAWDTCSADEKRLYARMQEVFAGFLEHADAQVGRVVDAIETMGLGDDTLIIYVVGDNGPSAEGSMTGTVNNMKTQHGYPDSVEAMLEVIDELGGPKHENHYPVPWCWAGSSPFQWCKQVASHFGGTRNPVVMRWPGRITARGELRSQFHHAIDIVPTILEAAGIDEPISVNGVPQKPIEGTSMIYSWDQADAPSTRTTQYFEMFGNRALYHDGWVAGARHGKLPWETAGSAPDFSADTWELYNIAEDFSQADDLAESEPEKLRELQDLFWAEAAKYNVLPLDDRFIERADASLKPSYLRGKTRFLYLPGTHRIPEPSSPPTKNVNHTIAAEVEVPESGGDGVIACCGGESGGYSFFMKAGKLYWEHNWFSQERYRVESKVAIPAGHHVLSVRIECDTEGEFATGGIATLRIGEEVIGKGRFDKQVGARFTVGESFDIGCDLVTPVSELYESPADFNGAIKRVLIDVSDKTVDTLAHEIKIALMMQ